MRDPINRPLFRRERRSPDTYVAWAVFLAIVVVLMAT